MELEDFIWCVILIAMWQFARKKVKCYRGSPSQFFLVTGLTEKLLWHWGKKLGTGITIKKPVISWNVGVRKWDVSSKCNISIYIYGLLIKKSCFLSEYHVWKLILVTVSRVWVQAAYRKGSFAAWSGSKNALLSFFLQYRSWNIKSKNTKLIKNCN